MKALTHWKERLEPLEKGEVAVFLHGDHPDRFVYRNWKDGHLNIYVSIFTSYDLDGEDSDMWNREELYDDTYMFVTIYPVFAAMMRKLIKDGLKAVEEKDNGTLECIRENLARDGGKIVLDGGGKYRILAGAVATDEDYYYLLVTEGGGIEYESCVGKCEAVEGPPNGDKGAYDAIVEYLEDLKAGAFNGHLLLNVTMSLVGSREVLITPLYLPGTNERILTFFNETGLG